MLWAKGTFSRETSTGLLHNFNFHNCKVFVLWAADEPANLEVTRFEFSRDMKQYAQPDNPRCFVGLLKTYLAAIPADGPFYRQPLAAKNGKLRYSQQKVGIHTLRKVFKTMCEEAGLHGRFTGHLGKVTLTTTLFNAKVDEQLIMARTGHRSNAVRVYKRSSEEINKEIPDKLQPPKKPEEKQADVPVDDADADANHGNQKTD
ncbi:uncharacterized protein [Haliotis asinina]|uniref:uncharacterized protein n=1 Tax=Haliotis asinina TaxID=109174 RepID=UPI0035325B98